MTRPHRAVGHRLPRMLARPLFGDRDRFGRIPDETHPDWIAWQHVGVTFYDANQRTSVGRWVNDLGHRIVGRVDLSDRDVLEIGPGALDHMAHWRGEPRHFTAIDVDPAFLEPALARLRERDTPHTWHLMPRSGTIRLPFADASFDVVLSFYALEHIYPLAPYLAELRRVLRPGGEFVGAIPTEGGLAWGIGRHLTSRRWLRRHTTIHPERLISWEHPNFADEILNVLATSFDRLELRYEPFRLPSIDANLIVGFLAGR